MSDFLLMLGASIMLGLPFYLTGIFFLILGSRAYPHESGYFTSFCCFTTASFFIVSGALNG